MGKIPVFAEYATMWCIVDPGAGITRDNYTDEVKDCALPDGPKGIKIPTWQRPLEWKVDDVDKLVTSQSNLFGTAILANLGQHQPWILIDGLQRLATGTALLFALYDDVLAPSPNRPSEANYFATVKRNFSQLYAIFQWNHNMLLEHGRFGIRTSYKRLFDDVVSYVREKLDDNPEEFGKKITQTLTERQIAVDPYAGFSKDAELVKTFLEINTKGMDLSPIDLLRTVIIIQMGNRNLSNAEIDSFENKFTEVFPPEKISGFAKTLGIQIYNVMDELETFVTGWSGGPQKQAGHDPVYVFPNWDELDKKTLDDFLEYVEKSAEFKKERLSYDPMKYKWPYLAEIGYYDLPYCCVIWFYYRNHYLKFLENKQQLEDALTKKIKANDPNVDPTAVRIRVNDQIKEILQMHTESKSLQAELEISKKDPESDWAPNDERVSEIDGKLSDISEREMEVFKIVPDLYKDLPDFLDGDLDTRDDITKFYRATIRRVIAGSVGRSGNVLVKIMRSEITTMGEASEVMCPTESGSIDAPPVESWLKGRLLDIKAPIAKRIFNVCLAPDRGQLSDFQPLIFANKTNYYNIDHLIPDSFTDTKRPGYSQSQCITNFAPLESDKNNTANNTPCSLKLNQSQNIYPSMMDIHPYCKWLVETHFSKHSNDSITQIDGRSVHPLDDQSNLREGVPSGIGDERINEIYRMLSTKL